MRGRTEFFMIEYLPWSKKVLHEMLDKQKKGAIPTLDLELTAQCSGACCIYCDSKPDVCYHKQEGEIDYLSLKKLILEAKERGLTWIYTCGLGEPLEDDKFWNMIHLLKQNEISLSMFSNGVFINDINVARELKENNVNIILKMDTFDDAAFDSILGKKGTADKIYNARDLLLEAGFGSRSGYTDFAFSIVPTSISIEGIPEVVSFAKKNGIFASIGELEQAGDVINKNLKSSLEVPMEKIINLKAIADSYIEGKYMRPICPCILTGLHIDNIGNCIVDEDTGLNCKWFLLKDPRTVKIGNIRTENIDNLFEKVNAYRKDCFINKIDMIKTSCDVSYVFGGCGGNPKDIISLALEQYNYE